MSLRERLRVAALLCLIQITNYCLLVVNYRAVAKLDYAGAVGTDLLLAALGFCVIRKIAKVEDAVIPAVGYTLGGVIGTIAGLTISARWHGA